MKKIISLFLILTFAINIPASAFQIKKKKAADPLDQSEKLSYVNTDFMERFEDPYLVYYVNHAIKNNHDVRKASWQVEEYRQNVKYSFGQELPSLSVGANYAGIHLPRIGNINLRNNAFILPFILRYEPDFLLKNRDKTKSVKKTYEASKFEEKAVYISLVSDITTLYINIMQYDTLIESQEGIVNIKKIQLDREMQKFNHGVIDNARLNSAKRDYETVKNNLEEYKKSRETSLNNFAVLIGISPNSTDDIMRAKLSEFEYHSQIPATIPSDVIFSRPDVMASEAKLEKANIDVRVARKEFLPTFNILGVLAFNTIFPGNFFNWDSILAAILAGATQDIFKGGTKVANLKINKARYEQMFEDYRQTDLNAVKEINNALYIIKTDTEIDNNTIRKLGLQQRDYIDSQSKYKRGIISYPELLSEEEKVISMYQNQIQTKATRLVNYLTLYKAVGGKL